MCDQLYEQDQPRKVRAESSVLCIGGSLGGMGSYREIVLTALREEGHVFRHVKVVADAAGLGAHALVATWKGK